MKNLLFVFIATYFVFIATYCIHLIIRKNRLFVNSWIFHPNNKKQSPLQSFVFTLKRFVASGKMLLCFIHSNPLGLCASQSPLSTKGEPWILAAHTLRLPIHSLPSTHKPSIRIHTFESFLGTFFKKSQKIKRSRYETLSFFCKRFITARFLFYNISIP